MAGSLTTALAQKLPVLITGWSALEGLGAALILPRSLRWSRATSRRKAGHAPMAW
jgi:hypothetical protein